MRKVLKDMGRDLYKAGRVHRAEEKWAQGADLFNVLMVRRT
jgi:hypothetical protein